MTMCPLADDVLAHFLDGQPDPRGGADGLQAHLLQCDACQRTLAATRRLDALVAATTPAAVDAALADRLLTAAVLEAAPRVPRTRVRLAAQRAVWAAAGFAAAAVLLSQWPALLPSPPPQPERGAVAPRPDAAAAPDRAVLVLPGRAAARAGASDSRRSARAPELRAGLADRALRADFVRALEAGMLARACALGLPLRGPASARACALALAAAHRRARVAALLASPRRADLLAACGFLAADPLDAERTALLHSAREDATFVARLARALGDGLDRDLLVTAARLGATETDRALRARVAGNVAATETAAAALASADCRQQVALLLDLWTDLQRRGLETETASGEGDLLLARAARWFAPLRSDATAALIAQARDGRHAERRRNCLLALAARSDPAAVPYLLEIALGRRHEESLLAAFALARCAQQAPDELRRAALAARQPGELLAALASMRDSATLAAIDDLDLTAAERAFLCAGAFSRRQFPIAARLLHQHRPAF
jgi:hypothetical protein